MAKNQVDKAILNIIEEINQYPFIYRNEADIQARLYNQLCNVMNESEPTHKTGFKNLITNLVHCEYFGGKGQRVDLVVFDKEDIKNISMNSMEKSRSGEYVKVTDAIEIKTEQGSTGQFRRSRVFEDIDKLITLRKEGKSDNLYFMYIIRWPTKNKSKQEEICDIVDDARKKCKGNDISFFSNEKDTYFLNYR